MTLGRTGRRSGVVSVSLLNHGYKIHGLVSLHLLRGPMAKESVALGAAAPNAGGGHAEAAAALHVRPAQRARTHANARTHHHAPRYRPCRRRAGRNNMLPTHATAPVRPRSVRHRTQKLQTLSSGWAPSRRCSTSLSGPPSKSRLRTWSSRLSPARTVYPSQVLSQVHASAIAGPRPQGGGAEKEGRDML